MVEVNPLIAASQSVTVSAVVISLFLVSYFSIPIGCTDFRTMSVENSVFPHLNGSSRVKLGDCVDVLCSIKVSLS